MIVFRQTLLALRVTLGTILFITTCVHKQNTSMGIMWDLAGLELVDQEAIITERRFLIIYLMRNGRKILQFLMCRVQTI